MSSNTSTGQLEAQIQPFKNVWRKGYFEGDPLDPMGASNYNKLNYMSVLYVTYLTCIKPYVNTNTLALEIGPGRGAWSKAILSHHPKELWCLDAVSAEQSRFWEYIGQRPEVFYHQVSDFKCSMLPDDYFTYFFTFGCFCHVTNRGMEEYMRNIHRKLKPGSHGFMMVGDFDKYNWAIDNLTLYEAERACHGRRYLPARILWKMIGLVSKPDNLRRKDKRQALDGSTSVTWHHLSVPDACKMLESMGYRIVDPDVGVNHRDPVIHFVRT